MLKTINKLLFYLKIFFLLIAFSFSLYITFMKMDFASSNILTILPIFIPFLVLLIFYVVSLFWDWKLNNLYYNSVSILSSLAIIIITFRTIFDKNIINYPASISFNFYNALEGKIKVLLYLMILGNIGILYYKKLKSTKIHS